MDDGLITGPDGRVRCWWPGDDDPGRLVEMGPTGVDRLLGDDRIIRHRGTMGLVDDHLVGCEVRGTGDPGPTPATGSTPGR